jgi:hypothetical protein
MRQPPSNRLVWFAMLGGAGAWLVQFLVNLYLTWAKCVAPNAPRALGLPVHDLEIGLSIGAILVNLSAQAVAVTLYRRSRMIKGIVEGELEGMGGAPPVGRIAFLSMLAMTVNFVTLMIVVMTAIGAPLLNPCQQA